LKDLAKEEHLLVNKRYFASDMEKAIEGIRTSFRASH
jgi:hypothetical protein